MGTEVVMEVVVEVVTEVVVEVVMVVAVEVVMEVEGESNQCALPMDYSQILLIQLVQRKS